MLEFARYAGQALFYAAFLALVGTFSSRPLYHQVPEGSAQIKLSFTHGGAPLDDCTKLTAKEVAKLPSAERRAGKCSRERVPLAVQLVIDGVTAYDAVLEPSGLSRDGQAQTYRKFLIPAGKHVIEARLRDSKRSEGFDYESSFKSELVPLQNLAIDFRAEQGGFLFR